MLAGWDIQPEIPKYLVKKFNLGVYFMNMIVAGLHIYEMGFPGISVFLLATISGIGFKLGLY